MDHFHLFKDRGAVISNQYFAFRCLDLFNKEKNSGPISRMYRYTLDEGWTDEGELIQENAALEQYGVYRVDNGANSNTFDILSRCSVAACDDSITCNDNGACQADGTCLCVAEFTGADCLSMPSLIFIISIEY